MPKARKCCCRGLCYVFRGRSLIVKPLSKKNKKFPQLKKFIVRIYHIKRF